MHTATMGVAATTVHAAGSPTTVEATRVSVIPLRDEFELCCGTMRLQVDVPRGSLGGRRMGARHYSLTWRLTRPVT